MDTPLIVPRHAMIFTSLLLVDLFLWIRSEFCLLVGSWLCEDLKNGTEVRRVFKLYGFYYSSAFNCVN